MYSDRAHPMIAFRLESRSAMMRADVTILLTPEPNVRTAVSTRIAFGSRLSWMNFTPRTPRTAIGRNV
jgi:hypothetical protein